MIIKYDVLYEKNNIILIVNLDFYYEFADFDFKGYTKNLKNKIVRIAKKKNANKVNIVINGILISTLLLTPQNLDSDYKTTFITNNTIKHNFNEIIFNKEDEINEDTIINVSIPKNDFEKEDNNEIIVNNNTNINSNNKKENSNENINNENNFIKDKTKEENNVNPNNSVNKLENTTEDEPDENNSSLEIDNNRYVTIHRSNGNVVKLNLEEYLIGVVGSEMPASFNIEALKAQAVVARTYALKRISENKILTDNTSTQVYKDNDQLKSMWKDDFNKYYNKVKNAVMATKGVVLFYNNNYIDAVYHSTSNGKTEDSIYVWGYDIPYLKSVESKTDVNASSYKKEATFTLENLSIILNTNITKDTTFILERNASGRVTNVKVNDIQIKGITFRTLLALRSTDFTIETNEDNAVITTYGYGHGVGMSQYGANGMANLGYSFDKILNHYYQNITIKNIN